MQIRPELHKYHRYRITDLKYAHDEVLFADSSDEMQVMLNSVSNSNKNRIQGQCK